MVGGLRKYTLTFNVVSTQLGNRCSRGKHQVLLCISLSVSVNSFNLHK